MPLNIMIIIMNIKVDNTREPQMYQEVPDCRCGGRSLLDFFFSQQKIS
jgi:hypothetical protein